MPKTGPHRDDGFTDVVSACSCYPKKFPDQIFCTSSPVNANMESMPAHQPLLDEDTDEDLTDEQIRELLNEAAVRMRAKAAAQPVTATDVPFKLPRLKSGHIADTYEKTDGNITRLDHSKLVDKKQQALANGIKKIEDPLQIKKQKKEVRSTGCFFLFVLLIACDDIYPKCFAEQTRAPSWLPSCPTEAPLVHSYTEAHHLYCLLQKRVNQQ
jgi:hypothetical protein